MVKDLSEAMTTTLDNENTSPKPQLVMDFVSLCKPTIFIMIGLPARGKSYIAKGIIRYLEWIGLKAKLINVGSLRRSFRCGSNFENMDSNFYKGSSKPPLTKDLDAFLSISKTELDGEQTSLCESYKFFDSDNLQYKELRNTLALYAMEKCLEWINDGVHVAIHDATNSNCDRRRSLLDYIYSKRDDIDVMFIESICDDEAMISTNIKLKLNGPDYSSIDPKIAKNDFIMRIEKYKSHYFHITPDECGPSVGYVKIINTGSIAEAYNVNTHVEKLCLTYLISTNTALKLISIIHYPNIFDSADNSELDENVTKFIENFVPIMKKNVERKYSFDDNRITETVQKSKNQNIEIWIPQTPAATEIAKKISTLIPGSKFRYVSMFYTFPPISNQHKNIMENSEELSESPSSCKIDDISEETEKTRIRYKLKQIILELENSTKDIVLLADKEISKHILSYYSSTYTQNSKINTEDDYFLYSIVPGPYYSSFSKYLYETETSTMREVFFRVKI